MGKILEISGLPLPDFLSQVIYYKNITTIQDSANRNISELSRLFAT